jgi:hypothetical protein
MLRLRFSLAAIIVLPSLAACSSNSSSQDGGVADAEPRDTQPADAASADAAASDMGCNALTGSGCEGGNACVYVVNTDQVQCRAVAQPKAHEAPCSTTQLDCDLGLSCVQLMRDPGPKCYKTCDPQSVAGCANLTGSSARYACAGLAMKSLGVCVGVGCDVLHDMCPSDQVCAPMGRGASCVPAGMTPRGGDCGMMQCQRGSFCLSLQGAPNPVCYEPCDPMVMMGACTNARARCAGLSGLPYGFCTRTPECDPLNDQCAAGRACQYVNSELVCRPPGPTAEGGDCSRDACQAGLLCLLLNGRPSAECFRPCNLMNPMCGLATQCASFGEPFGICVN